MAKPRPKAPSQKTEKPAPKPKAAAKPAAAAAGANDPALDAFTKALEAFHQKSWTRAAELFEGALAESDRLDLSARARQYLAAARQRVAEAESAKGKKKEKEEDGDPFLQAVFEKNRGDYAAALELCRQGGRDQKDERFAYLEASIHAVENRLDEALQALSRAIELNPKNRVHAYHDPDFAELRKDRDLRQLFGLA
jgi:tetratricopeptide (TPR) repeat protein